MYAHLKGRISSKAPPLVIVDCNGVGYELHVPMSTFYNLPAEGSEVKLLTQLVVREDAHLLYGFLLAEEKEAFRLLTKVNGIGARIALAILSGLSTSELEAAIVNQDGLRLTKVPGIGKKLADRLLVELKGAFKVGGLRATTPQSEGIADVSAALLALGYSEKEVKAALAELPHDITVNEGIRRALQVLG